MARTGAALIRASNVYAVEDRGKTWRLLAVTFLVYTGFLSVAALAPWWPVRLLASVFVGLTVVRLFIFLHDWQHGAVFTKSSLGAAAMWVVGVITLTTRSVWKQTHDFHHKNNAKMVGASIGSYPVVTVEMFKSLSASEQRKYRLARSPITILLAYFTLFCMGMVLAPFLRSPRVHALSPVVAIAHFSVFFGIFWLWGWQMALFTWFLPATLSMAAGGYLFYAQHNFPDIDLKNRSEWDYTYAALHSSSYFVMNPVMHWFTGNIGYHHVHHLNHRIPFYRLPEAMEGLSEVQNPGRTSWRPVDVWGCLRLKLWDPEQRRMVTFGEAGI